MKSLLSNGGGYGGILVKSLLVLGLLSPLASAKVASFRYYRFHVLKIQGTGTQTQLSEIKFYNGSTAITPGSAIVSDPTNDNPGGEGPTKAFDGDNTTKWLNNNFTASQAGLIFDFGQATSIDRYNYVTGNDSVNRDPVSWTFEGSNDQTNWSLVDVVYDATPNATRQALITGTNFIFPDTPQPVITSFELFDGLGSVTNGTDINFVVNVPYASSVKISNSSNATVVDVPDRQETILSVTPPTNKDTIYTLTATSGTQSLTRTIGIRETQQNPQTFRYVRYQPLKTRSGGANVSLGEFRFYSSGSLIPINGVTTSDSTNTLAPKLIDGDQTTLWNSTTAYSVTFDLGAGAVFDGYSFATTTDTTQNPIQWVLDGSNDGTNWTLIDNMATFDYPTVAAADSGILPTPGAAASFPYLAFTPDATFSTNGEAVTITYLAEAATSLTFSPDLGVSNLAGTVVVRPTATTTYTATAKNAAGMTTTKTFTVTVTTPLGSINYPNFESAADINLVGTTAKFVNDFASFPTTPNAKRLRLTDISSTFQTSAAWSMSKMKVSDGFQTSFDVQLTYPVYINGADGISFIIQNTPQKYKAALSGVLSAGPKSIAIALDTFPDAAGETQANLEILKGPSRATDMLQNYNLDANGSLKVAKGYKGMFMTTQANAAPYHVDITYTPGSLTVAIDNKVVADHVAIDLGAYGAYDVDGRAYLGFGSNTRSIVAYQDIVNWTFTPGASVGTPLTITNSAFTFGASPQVALTFTSTSGKTYRVTQSTDLVTWTPVGSTTVAAGPSTSVNVPFTAGVKSFFRVELMN